MTLTSEQRKKLEDKEILIALYSSIVETGNRRQGITMSAWIEAAKILHKMAKYKDCFYLCKCCKCLFTKESEDVLSFTSNQMSITEHFYRALNNRSQFKKILLTMKMEGY